MVLLLCCAAPALLATASSRAAVPAEVPQAVHLGAVVRSEYVERHRRGQPNSRWYS